MGGHQHNTRGVLGVGGYPSSQMWGISHVYGVMPKIHLSGFWPNHLF